MNVEKFLQKGHNTQQVDFYTIYTSKGVFRGIGEMVSLLFTLFIRIFVNCSRSFWKVVLGSHSLIVVVLLVFKIILFVSLPINFKWIKDIPHT